MSKEVAVQTRGQQPPGAREGESRWAAGGDVCWALSAPGPHPPVAVLYVRQLQSGFCCCFFEMVLLELVSIFPTLQSFSS